MLQIYFVRHGETVWNTLKIFQGRQNSPLTEKGISQAKKLGEYLKNTYFDKFYSSPLGRAKETASYILGDRNLEINEIEEFREIDLGKAEGLPKEEFENTYPTEYHNFWFNAKDYDPSAFEGETYQSVLERVEKGLKKIVTENKEGRILIVSHGIALKAIFNVINKKGIEEFSKQEVPENTSTTIVEYDNGEFKIVSFSDTTHLK